MKWFIERSCQQNKWLFGMYNILLYSICVCTGAHICVYTSDEEAEIISRISGIANEIISRA